MIHKRRMHRRNFDTRHVASDAVFLRNWASLAGMIWRDFFYQRQNMAGEALFVIRSGFADKLLVRVVASGAGEARIAIAPAAAVLETIGLEADVGDTGDAHLVNVV